MTASPKNGVFQIQCFRWDLTGGMGFVYFRQGKQICRISDPGLLPPDIRIFARKKSYTSPFDWHSVLRPGLSRSVRDEETGEEAWRLIYLSRERYKILCGSKKLWVFGDPDRIRIFDSDIDSDVDFDADPNGNGHGPDSEPGPPADSTAGLFAGSTANRTAGFFDGSTASRTAGSFPLVSVTRVENPPVVPDEEYYELREYFRMEVSLQLEESLLIPAITFPLLRFAR